MRKAFLWVIAATLSLAAMQAVADERSEADIKRLALEAILENPEIVMQAVEILQQRDSQAQEAAARQALSGQREKLENDPNAPVLGNPDGDATIVEFFDYNCPYCKRAAPIVKALIAKDPKLRVVYREWPILGEDSVFAARAALAARKQGKYEEFHWAMMELKGRASEASVMKAIRDLGLDEAQLRSDMNAPEVDAHIQASTDLARSLGFSGTPSFVVGDALAPGLVPESDLERLVSDLRNTK